MRHQDELVSGHEFEIARATAKRRIDRHQRQLARRCIDVIDGDAVMAAVGGQKTRAVRRQADGGSRVLVFVRIVVRQHRDRLDARVAAVGFFEQCDRRGQFVDDINAFSALCEPHMARPRSGLRLQVEAGQRREVAIAVVEIVGFHRIQAQINEIERLVVRRRFAPMDMRLLLPRRMRATARMDEMLHFLHEFAFRVQFERAARPFAVVRREKIAFISVQRHIAGLRAVAGLEAREHEIVAFHVKSRHAAVVFRGARDFHFPATDIDFRLRLVHAKIRRIGDARHDAQFAESARLAVDFQHMDAAVRLRVSADVCDMFRHNLHCSK